MTAEVAAEQVPAPRPAVGGWHYAEWLCELAGTAILVFGALSVVTLVFHRGAVVAEWVPSTSLRLLIVGVSVAVVFNLIAISPLGRRSGAHLNPAVTLAFWITGHVHPHDLGGYWAGQFAGALVGAALLRVAWSSDAASVNYGAIRPTVSTLDAVGVEAALTAALVLTVFVFLSSRSTARWTPVAAGIVVASAIRLGGRATGTGINPARSLGPNIVAGDFGFWWLYVVAPTAGAVLVALVWKLGPRVILTAKLFHDPWYPSVLRTHLPALPPRT